MLTREFDYELPHACIAQYPAPRGQSRLLVLDAEGAQRHRRFADLPELLAPGDLLVVNDTRVLPARLFARHPLGGGRIEVLLVERHGPVEWDVLLRPARRARSGTVLELSPDLSFRVLAKLEDGRHRVHLCEPVEPHLETIGHVPLPPYIKRPDEAEDRSRYQTVFARHPGAIAAPTAGLHFSPELLDRLAERGIRHVAVTLHVGPGTFKPISSPWVHDHRMEAERYRIPAATAKAIDDTRRRGGRIVAVGTTVVRALEGAADAKGRLQIGSGRTDLFITPGYSFRMVDLLITNFHLPRSTLLLLISAFAGRERVFEGYCDAIESGYRFYSYGDAMLARRWASPPIPGPLRFGEGSPPGRLAPGL